MGGCDSTAGSTTRPSRTTRKPFGSTPSRPRRTRGAAWRSAPSGTTARPSRTSTSPPNTPRTSRRCTTPAGSPGTPEASARYKAIEDFTKAIKLNPELLRPTTTAVTRGEPRRRTTRCLKTSTRLSNWTPTSPRRSITAGWSCTTSGKSNVAKDQTRAIELDPKYVLAYVSRSAVYYAKKDYDKAVADCTRALELDPKHLGAFRTARSCGTRRTNTTRPSGTPTRSYA